jgi:L-aspartate oxidase
MLSTHDVRVLMWRNVGVFRTHTRMAEAVAALDVTYAAERTRMVGAQSDAHDWRRFNLLTVARLIACAALRREESRGGHFREDFPERDDQHWRFHAIDSARA